MADAINNAPKVQRQAHSIIEISCTDCTEKIKTRSRKRLYCDGCQHKRKLGRDAIARSLRKKPPRMYVCERCFTQGQCTGRGKNKYCGECAIAVRRERDRIKDKIRRPALIVGSTRVCSTCEGEFTVTGGKQVHCPVCIKKVNAERSRKWAEENPDRVLANVRAYNDRNRERVNERNREITKRPHVREYRREWDRQYRQKPKQRVDQRMKTAIAHSLKGEKNGRSWEALVGYTVDELYSHLERQFVPGMSWENIGDWHIDHIVPKSSFQYETDDCDEFRAAWAITNLRPLWSTENLSKGPKRLLLI